MSIPVTTSKKTYSYSTNIYFKIMDEIANLSTRILFQIRSFTKTSQYCKIPIDDNFLLKMYYKKYYLRIII